MSFHAWKLLSKYLLRDSCHKPTLALYHFRDHICAPRLPLYTYTDQLLSPNFDFIASLTISGPCHVPAAELLQLSQLPNLGVLEIIASHTQAQSAQLPIALPEISNSLFKSWSLQENPFPTLRSLRIWGPGLITQNVFRYLDKFPSLVLFDVLGAFDDWENASHLGSHFGWRSNSLLSRYWDPLLRYLQLLLPPLPGSPCHSPGSPHYRTRADFIDETLSKHVGNKNNEIKRVARRSRMPLAENMEHRRARNMTKIQLQKNTIPRTSADQNMQNKCNDDDCQGSEDLWNFWIFAFIGHLTHDEDLLKAIRENAVPKRPRTMDEADHAHAGLAEEVESTQAVFENIVLPALPVAHLQLGDYSRTRLGLHPVWPGNEDALRCTFAKTDLSIKYMNGLLRGMEMDPTVLESGALSSVPENQPSKFTSERQKRGLEHQIKPKPAKRIKLNDLLAPMPSWTYGSKY